MKFKIQAGAEIDVATKKEVRDEIEAARTSWIGEVARGDRFRRFSAYAYSDAAGTVAVGQTGQYIGPAEGFVWSVTRFAVTSGYDPATQVLSLTLGSDATTGSAVIIPDLGTYNDLSGNQLVLYPGDRLYVVGTVAASSRVWVTGQARELPISLAWRL